MFLLNTPDFGEQAKYALQKNGCGSPFGLPQFLQTFYGDCMPFFLQKRDPRVIVPAHTVFFSGPAEKINIFWRINYD